VLCWEAGWQGFGRQQLKTQLVLKEGAVGRQAAMCSGREQSSSEMQYCGRRAAGWEKVCAAAGDTWGSVALSPWGACERNAADSNALQRLSPGHVRHGWYIVLGLLLLLLCRLLRLPLPPTLPKTSRMPCMQMLSSWPSMWATGTQVCVAIFTICITTCSMCICSCALSCDHSAINIQRTIQVLHPCSFFNLDVPHRGFAHIPK
jgi:hypothetical protein